jgi:hypothetical protein
MGEWAITIHGAGIHDNGREDDADAILRRFVDELRKSQLVRSAVLTVGSAREVHQVDGEAVLGSYLVH